MRALFTFLECKGNFFCWQVDLLCLELSIAVADNVGCVQVLSVVGILQDETDPMVSVMKVRQCVRVCLYKAYACCTHAGHAWCAFVGRADACGSICGQHFSALGHSALKVCCCLAPRAGIKQVLCNVTGLANVPLE